MSNRLSDYLSWDVTIDLGLKESDLVVLIADGELNAYTYQNIDIYELVPWCHPDESHSAGGAFICAKTAFYKVSSGAFKKSVANLRWNQSYNNKNFVLSLNLACDINLDQIVIAPWEEPYEALCRGKSIVEVPLSQLWFLKADIDQITTLDKNSSGKTKDEEPKARACRLALRARELKAGGCRNHLKVMKEEENGLHESVIKKLIKRGEKELSRQFPLPSSPRPPGNPPHRDPRGLG